MIDDKSPYLSDSVGEFIERIPGELPIDAVGFWQIVSPGRGVHGYALSGDDFLEFIRRCLLGLLRKGARPVLMAAPPIFWTVVDRLVGRPEAIAERIICEWLAAGAPDPHPAGPEPGQPDLIGLWFATPNIYQDGGKPAPAPPPDLASARNKWDGRTVDDWIADRLREIDVAEVEPNDPVGMWLIVPAGVVSPVVV